MRQRRHMRGVLPQFSRLAAHFRIGNIAPELTHDDGRGDGIERLEAEPHDRRAHVVDFTAGTIVSSGVGQRHGPCRQQRLGHHQFGGRLQMAIGIVQDFLQPDRGIDVGREHQLAACRLQGDMSESFLFVHEKLVSLVFIAHSFCRFTILWCCCA